MTRAEFDSRYRLGDRIAEGGVLSYRAHDLAAGREVTIHLFAGTLAAEAEQLHDLLLRLESRDRALVLAETDVEGIPVVVTEALPGFTTLPSWLESRVPGAAPAPEGSATGEFTRVFGSRPPEPPSGGVSPPRPAPSLPEPAVPPGNEFGRLFGPADPGRAPRPVIRLGGSAPPPSPAPASPFQVPDLSRPTDERPLFSKDVASSGTGPLWPAAPLDDPSAAPPVTSAPARGPADIADLIAAAGASGSIGRRQDESREAHADASSAPTEQASGRRSSLPLVLILTLLLLSAVGLVVYFAFKAP
jgi:hypothetical protein